MILECPNCSAKFTVPDGAIGSDGKQVRCGKCKHIWHATPELASETFAAIPTASSVAPSVAKGSEALAAPDLDQVLSSLSNLEEKSSKTKGKKRKSTENTEKKATLGDYKTPVNRKKHPLQVAAIYFAYILLTIVIAVAWTLKEHPDWLGIQNSQGFAFESMKIERMKILGGDRFETNPMFMIEGIVRNTSNEPKPRPPIRITLIDNAGREVYKKNYPSPESLIPAGNAVTFTVEKLEQYSERDSHFSVEMGNGFELMLRELPSVESKYVKKD